MSSDSIPYRPLPPIQTVFPKPAPPKVELAPLTDKQLENWRKYLFTLVGPIANIMPRQDIERVRLEIHKKTADFSSKVEQGLV